MRHVFLSPHMDDAVLSAGSLILTLIKEKKHVVIVTVFSNFGKRPISFPAQKYIFRSGCIRLSTFSEKRKGEDQKAMDLLGIPCKYLMYVDGGFRKNPQGKLLYPTFNELFSGTISFYDKKLLKKLEKDILACVRKPDIIYAPLAVGNHADHILVNRIAKTLPNITYYWLDQPYGWEKRIPLHVAGYNEVFRLSHKKEKKKILSCYPSQIKLLYPKGIPFIDEVFFERKSNS